SVPGSKLEEAVARRAKEFAARSPRPAGARGIKLDPLTVERSPDGAEYSSIAVAFARSERLATITVRGPDAAPPKSGDEMVTLGSQFWPLSVARELDDGLLDLRCNEFDLGASVVKFTVVDARRPG